MIGATVDVLLLATTAGAWSVAGLLALMAGGRSRIGAAAIAVSAAGCVAAFLLGGSLVLGVGVGTVEASVGTVLTFPVVDVRFDALAGVFLLALGAVGFAGALHAFDDIGSGADSALTRVAHPAFLLALLLVFGSRSAFSFLLAWELMALASGVLVIGARPSAEQLRAGFIYLAATHLATAALLVAFAVLTAAAGGAFDFAAWAAAAPALDPLVRDALFLLLVVGLGTKAGIVPFHVWLPRAHPAAPAHVSALMSGVMIKTGIYGLIRFVGEVLGVDAGPAWWGLLLIGLGAGSAVLGVLYALMERDLKRLLAFSSIENVGIVLIGVGAAFAFSAEGLPGAATIALTAALLHALNHGLFKGLLFVGAGAIHHATATRDLNRLGGLARVMPWTALAFGVGAVALGGLPPLNGFVGEWQTFQSLIGLAATPADAIVRSIAVLAIGALALSVALALAAAVKIVGTAFLALPRTDAAAHAHEASRPTRVALGVLASLCLVAGVAGAPIAGALGTVAAGSTGAATPVATAGLPLVLGADVRGAFAPAPLAVLGAVLVAGVVLAAGLLARARRPLRGDTWTCGIAPQPAFEYTATSYAKPVRLFFRRLLQPTREVVVDRHPGTPVARSITYRAGIAHPIDRHVYGRSYAAAIALAQLVRRIQNGSLQFYLAYALAAVIVLLLVTR